MILTASHLLPLPTGGAILVRAVVSGAVQLLMVVAIAELNPFGIDDWASREGKAVWQIVYGSKYPVGPPIAPDPAADSRHAREPASDEIRVIYADEASGAHWQNFTASALANMLYTVSSYPADRPRAVFVDFALVGTDASGGGGAALVDKILQMEPCAPFGNDDPRGFECLLSVTAQLTHYYEWGNEPGCDGQIARLLCIIRSGGMPIIYAAPYSPHDEIWSSGALPTQLDALGRVGLLASAYVQWDQYWLHDAEAIGPSLSPAGLLFAAYCADGSGGTRCRNAHDPLQAQGPGEWPDRYSADLNLVWGIGAARSGSIAATYGEQLFGSAPSAFNDEHHEIRFGEDSCVTRQKVEETRVSYLWDTLTGGNVDLREARYCEYVETVNISAFERHLTAEALPAVLRDKLILLGSQFRSSTDRIEAEPFGTLPGVHQHAMALDNLITFGSTYPEADKKLAGVQLSSFLEGVALFVIAASVSLTNGQLRRYRNRPDYHPGQRGKLWGRRIRILLIWLAFTASCVALLNVFVLNRAPLFDFVAPLILLIVGGLRLIITFIRPLTRNIVRCVDRRGWLTDGARLVFFDLDPERGEAAASAVLPPASAPVRRDSQQLSKARGNST